MIKTTLYHRASGGRVKVWSCWTIGSVVHREWGLFDGTMQTTNDALLPGQRKTAAQMASEQFTRLIKSKMDEGYVTSLDDVRELVGESEEMDFRTLPKAFAPPKPIDGESLDNLRKWDQEKGTLCIQRKRDGQRHFVLIDVKGKVHLYSRRLEDMTDHMPRLVRILERLGLLPKTVIDGELIVDREGADDFRAVSTVTRALPQLAASRSNVLLDRHLLKYMVFDVLYWEGASLWKRTYSERLWYVHQLENRALKANDEPTIIGPDILDLDFDRAMTFARKEHWEGLVLWMLDEPVVVQMNGKAKLCGSYKWKPKCNGDFVAMGFYYGTGKNSEVAGGIHISQYIDGVLFPCGDCGGFKGDSIVRKQVLKWTFPCVVEIEYDKQEEDSGALRFPVFLRLRPDKPLKECVRGRQ